MVAEFLKQGIKYHFGVLFIQDYGRHFAFLVPFPRIARRDIQADLAADFFEGLQV